MPLNSHRLKAPLRTFSFPEREHGRRSLTFSLMSSPAPAPASMQEIGIEPKRTMGNVGLQNRTLH